MDSRPCSIIQNYFFYFSELLSIFHFRLIPLAAEFAQHAPLHCFGVDFNGNSERKCRGAEFTFDPCEAAAEGNF